jgi:hypothetical protein
MTMYGAYGGMATVARTEEWEPGVYPYEERMPFFGQPF